MQRGVALRARVHACMGEGRMREAWLGGHGCCVLLIRGLLLLHGCPTLSSLSCSSGMMESKTL